MTDQPAHTVIRFGVFEADLRAEELRRAGVRIKLQAQPFKVLALLLERPGEIVTREEIVQQLWGSDNTFVDYEQSLGAVLRKLRQALGDSASAPRYIETLRQKGYRFLLPTHTDGTSAEPQPPAIAPNERGAKPWFRSTLLLAACLAALAAVAIITALPSRLPSASASRSHVVAAEWVAGPPRNAKAWRAYQKGRFLWNARTAAAVESSIEYFQEAVNLDPDYAPAHAGLADAYLVLNLYTGLNRTVPIQRALAASERAITLDPSLAEPHAALAYLKFYHEWDWRGAEKAFRTAIALNPGYATAHQWYAELLFYLRRFPEAIREINRAHELEPQSVVISHQLASPYMFARDYTGAIEKIREALRLNPEFPLGIYMLATCYEQLGQYDEALAEYQRIGGTRMGQVGLGYVYGKTGRQQQARQVVQELLGNSKRDDLSPYQVARVYAGLGDVAQALTWLKKAREARDERMVMLKVDPKLDSLRSDPRFRDLLRDLGLA